MFKKICKISLNARIHDDVCLNLPLAKRGKRLKYRCLFVKNQLSHERRHEDTTTSPLESNQLAGLVPEPLGPLQTSLGVSVVGGLLAELQQPNGGQRKIEPSVCSCVSVTGCSAGGHFHHKVLNKEIISEIHLTRPLGARVSPMSSCLQFVGGKQRDV